MDAVVNVFSAGLRPESVFKYRAEVRTVAAKIQTMYNVVSQLSGDPFLSGGGLIITGSVVEGANFARNFSKEYDTVTEMEFDMMFQVGSRFPKYLERDFCYIPENETFFHMRCKKDDEEVVGFKEKIGDVWFERIVVELDGFYFVNSLLVKEVMELLTKMSELLLDNLAKDVPADKAFAEMKRIAEGARNSIRSGERVVDLVEDSRACRAETQLIARSASAQMKMIDHKNSATEQRSKQQSTDRKPETETIKPTSPDYSDQFFQRCYAEYDKIIERVDSASSQSLNMLRIVEDELVFALNPAKGVPLRIQAAKAQKYLTTIMDSMRTLAGFSEQMISCTAEVSGIEPHEFLAAVFNERTWKVRDFSNRLTSALSIDPKRYEKSETAIGSVLFEIETEFVANGLVFMEIQNGFMQLVRFKQMWELANKFNKKGKPKYEKFGDLINRTSADMIACFGLDFWPSVAGEWLTRERQWPDATTVDAIARKGVHMIGKQFCHPDIDWRLSFSVAEIELSGLWTEPQLFIYFIFKSLFYRFILSSNEIKHKVYDRDPAAPADKQKKSIQSYFAKTIILNVSESFPQSCWSIPNAAECLIVLFYVLKSALECRTLAHHFIPSVNLLQGIDECVLDEAVDAIDMVLGKPEWVAAQMEPRFADIRRFLDTAEDLQSVMTDVEGFVAIASELFPKSC